MLLPTEVGAPYDPGATSIQEKTKNMQTDEIDKTSLQGKNLQHHKIGETYSMHNIKSINEPTIYSSKGTPVLTGSFGSLITAKINEPSVFLS